MPNIYHRERGGGGCSVNCDWGGTHCIFLGKSILQLLKISSGLGISRMRLTLCQGPFAKCQVLCCNWVEKSGEGCCVGLQDFALRTRDHSIWRISNKSMARHCHQSMALIIFTVTSGLLKSGLSCQEGVLCTP